ncbi:unnamed protein product [Urochloa humidicola]
MEELRRLDKQGAWLRFLFHTRAPPMAPSGPWPSLLRPRKLKQAILAPLSRKDEDRPLLFVSRWDLRLWASKELAAKDQVVVKNGLNSVHQFIAMSPSSRGQQRSFNCLSEVSVCMH